VFKHMQIGMVHGRSSRPELEMLRGRRQLAQRGHARVNDRVGCEEIPIVVADITFYLVAGCRRSPEKIRRKHVAHDCHPRPHGMVSPICAAPCFQHYKTAWMTHLPHVQGMRLNHTIFARKERRTIAWQLRSAMILSEEGYDRRCSVVLTV